MGRFGCKRFALQTSLGTGHQSGSGHHNRLPTTLALKVLANRIHKQLQGIAPRQNQIDHIAVNGQLVLPRRVQHRLQLMRQMLNRLDAQKPRAPLKV